jgi:hypothetical protein
MQEQGGSAAEAGGALQVAVPSAVRTVPAAGIGEVAGPVGVAGFVGAHQVEATAQPRVVPVQHPHQSEADLSDRR